MKNKKILESRAPGHFKSEYFEAVIHYPPNINLGVILSVNWTRWELSINLFKVGLWVRFGDKNL